MAWVQAHIRAHTHTHREKFIPENRGCVSTSMAAGRSMHSPPPELTDAGRRGGQPLHARCHRNALSLKHRLIITDARPFSLSLSLSFSLLGRHLYTPLGLSRWGTRLLQSTLRFSPRFPLFFLYSRSHPLIYSLVFPTPGMLSTFLVLSYLLAGSGRVRDDGEMVGEAECTEVGRRGGSFRPSGDVLALKLSRDRELHELLGYILL